MAPAAPAPAAPAAPAPGVAVAPAAPGAPGVAVAVAPAAPAAPGAVEDAGSADWGDAPDSYQTSEAEDGPRHTASEALNGQVFAIGKTVDLENDGHPSLKGQGDDKLGTDDEDAFPDPLVLDRSGLTVDVPVPVTNTGHIAGVMGGWLDFNNNGKFDADESTVAPIAPNATTVTLTFKVPAAAEGKDYAGYVNDTPFIRIRIYPDTASTPTVFGAVKGGEVEDHPVVWGTTPKPSATPSVKGQLPVTGQNSWTTLVPIGAGLLVLGGVLFAWAYRRRLIIRA
ncbi:GEVED domain-containing protein [Longispora fulva]|uniref:LPXTG-motif cell wall-anchored protein n=1 Tax=Longispora fulva TaxID=619741 RepID=A0A8J7GJS1_9ACTN|nr:GEVED domain-containing protein [Longispora fulva]MBG6139436.1 LPXTG-motif cell wall-anchored protein [Longispora fulva]